MIGDAGIHAISTAVELIYPVVWGLVLIDCIIRNTGIRAISTAGERIYPLVWNPELIDCIR